MIGIADAKSGDGVVGVFLHRDDLAVKQRYEVADLKRLLVQRAIAMERLRDPQIAISFIHWRTRRHARMPGNGT